MIIYFGIEPVVVVLLILIGLGKGVRGARRGSLLLFWHALVVSLATLLVSWLGLLVFADLASRGVHSYWGIYSPELAAAEFRDKIVWDVYVVGVSGVVFLAALAWFCWREKEAGEVDSVK